MSDPRMTLGVLGGMGPAATADFMRKLVDSTPAQREADYGRVAVWSNPQIPDRTRALLGLGPTPVPAMVDGIQRLQTLGARLIVIPCNTAHAFLPELRAQSDVEILDMISITLDDVTRAFDSVARIGILSTEGTRRIGLYSDACRARGLEPVELTQREQEELADHAISLVKQGKHLDVAASLVRDAAAALRDRGAQVAIAGCTEIPLVSGLASNILPIVDATESLARAAIRRTFASVGA